MSNIQDVDLPRHAWDTPPSLLIVSPTPPSQSVDAFYEYEALSRYDIPSINLVTKRGSLAVYSWVNWKLKWRSRLSDNEIAREFLAKIWTEEHVAPLILSTF